MSPLTVEELQKLGVVEFRELWDAVMDERDRRDVVQNAHRKLEQLQREFLAARDGIKGIPTKENAPLWKAPESPIDYYPIGWLVRDSQGKLFQSLAPSNSVAPAHPDGLWQFIPEKEKEPPESIIEPEPEEESGELDEK